VKIYKLYSSEVKKKMSIPDIGGSLGFSKSKEKSKNRSEIDQTTTSNPWEQQAPFLQQGFTTAEELLHQNMQPNEDMRQGWDAQLAQLGNMQGLASQGVDTQQMLLSPDQLDPNSNPYLRANLDALQTQLGQSLNQVNQQSAGAGMFGGSRQGVAEGEAITGAQGVASNMLMNHYTQGLQNMQQAQAMNAGVMQNTTMPGQVQSNIGYQQQQVPQQALNNYWGIVGSNNWGGTEHTEGVQTGSSSGKQSGWGTQARVGA